MLQLIVSDEEARMIQCAEGAVEVRDGAGRLLGKIAPEPAADDVDAMQRALASDQPRYTTAHVLSHLNSLASQ